MKKGLLARFLRHQGGSSALEFAFVAGPLLMLVLGGVEFGRVMWVRQALYETAISGARCMGIRQTQCATNGVYSAEKTATFVAAAATAWRLTIPTSAMTLTASTDCAGVAGFSKVSLTYNFKSYAPQLVGGGEDGVPLAMSACFPNQP